MVEVGALRHERHDMAAEAVSVALATQCLDAVRCAMVLRALGVADDGAAAKVRASAEQSVAALVAAALTGVPSPGSRAGGACLSGQAAGASLLGISSKGVAELAGASPPWSLPSALMLPCDLVWARFVLDGPAGSRDLKSIVQAAEGVMRATASFDHFRVLLLRVVIGDHRTVRALRECAWALTGDLRSLFAPRVARP